MAGAHHEHVVFYAFGTCHAVDHERDGRAISGFDYGRGTVMAYFRNGGHDTGLIYRGNTETFKQCDGYRVGSDGQVGLIYVNSIQY